MNDDQTGPRGDALCAFAWAILTGLAIRAGRRVPNTEQVSFIREYAPVGTATRFERGLAAVWRVINGPQHDRAESYVEYEDDDSDDWDPDDDDDSPSPINVVI